MDSFKIYLPSNACSELFPHNSPSDYRTRFDKAIELEGDWEVGVESIIYDSLINDEREQGLIDLSIKAKESISVNSIYSYEFVLKSDGTWAGYDGIVPDSEFETDPKNVEGIIKTLNNMSHQIVKREPTSHKLINFAYDTEKDTEKYKTFYMCVDEAFTLAITNKLGRVLGFDYKTIFRGGESHVASHKRETDLEPLTSNDYRLLFFNSNVVQKVKRVFLDPKPFQHYKDVEEQETKFIEMWKSTVFPFTNVSVEFKNRKLVLNNYGNHALKLSPDLMDSFYHADAVFGTRSQRWATWAADFRSIQSSDTWFVNIYSNKTATTYKNVALHSKLEVFPWKFNTIRKALIYLNNKVNRSIKDAVKQFYNEQNHKFHFDMNLANHCSLTLGKWLLFNMSPNLSYLLGFPQTPILKSTRSSREAGLLSNRSRQLYLLSDMVQTTAHGNKHLPILCDFLHNATVEKEMREKRFNPISFIPVVKSRLDFIHLQLTDDQYEHVKIKDTKTIVTLYFQRIK